MVDTTEWPLSWAAGPDRDGPASSCVLCNGASRRESWRACGRLSEYQVHGASANKLWLPVPRHPASASRRDIVRVATPSLPLHSPDPNSAGGSPQRRANIHSSAELIVTHTVSCNKCNGPYFICQLPPMPELLKTGTFSIPGRVWPGHGTYE